MKLPNRVKQKQEVKNVENNEVTLTIMVEKKTRREMKAHATLLGLSMKEYILSLYALDKENDLINKKSDT